MRVRSRLFLALLLGFSIAIGAQTPQPADPRTGLIVGQVVDGDSGKPIAGAIVSLGGRAATPAGMPGALPQTPRVLTGSEGRFVFRDLPRGSFPITATKPGYAEGAYGRRRPGGPSRPVTLTEGERIGDVLTRMWRYAAISGTVLDEIGEPLVGVRISAYRRVVVGGNRRFGARTFATTDDRGMYRIGSLIPGEYAVGMVSRQTGMPSSVSGDMRFSSQPWSLMQVGDGLYPLGRGAPIPPPPANGRLSVYPPTFYPSSPTPATTVTVASGEERTAIDLQLRPVPSVRVAGSVIGPDGPAPGILLMLVTEPIGEVPFEEESAMVRTDREGRFVIPAVPSQYSLRTMPFGGDGPPASRTSLWAIVPVTAGSADIDGVSVVLQPGLRITGRVEFDGSGERPTAQQLQQVPVLIEPADLPSVVPPGPTRVDASGAFTTPGLPPNGYFVRIRDSPTGWMFKAATYNGRNVTDLPLDLQGGDAANVILTFTDRWTGLRGTVQAADGMRSDDAIVLLFPKDPQAWSSYGPTPRRLKTARTTRTGEYSFTSVPTGDYYVVAVADDQAADWPDPQFLEMLARVATRIDIGDGEQRVQSLRMQAVR
jgi:hypothetical protein